MPKKACLDVRRNAMLLSECVFTDGTHQLRCCDCEHREYKCERMNTDKRCKDCSFPRVI